MIVLFWIALVIGIVLDGEVYRWSSTIPLDGEDIALSDHGVIVRPVGEIIPVVIPWYDVRSLPEGWTGDALKYKEIAETTRRARDRRLRGDPVSAGPLYLQLDQRLHPVHSQQRADIALGIMEYALGTADVAMAITGWLGVLEQEDHGFLSEGSGIDPKSGLHPGIVPVFDHPQALDLSAAATAITNERELILLELYKLAAMQEMSAPVDTQIEDLSKRIRAFGNRETGLRFVHDLVSCQLLMDATKRKAKRESLRRGIRSGSEGWMESWARLAIGVSLMREDENEDRERGVLECIAVVVASRDTPSSVVVLASQLGAQYLRTTGRTAQADTLEMSALIEPSTENQQPEPTR
ncbi:MAG: hypothetical protein JKY96_01025 [Phycisphaerales bacterium]|nr:hypothetical protein [Phycisphaerales bacterium]